MFFFFKLKSLIPAKMSLNTYDSNHSFPMLIVKSLLHLLLFNFTIPFLTYFYSLYTPVNILNNKRNICLMVIETEQLYINSMTYLKILTYQL